MATSSQTPQAPRVVTLHKAPLPKTVFVDRAGDVWTASGHNGRGELVLTCSEPHEARDAGEGASYPWTLHDVQQAFGPLIARTAVAA
ncbi:hypothetical protein AB0K66_26985 [Streptomyces werraensis]|uniref:hypothetical protein n=1 Tax=Streptomyces werraensis TaxID=68284 RepID=UPI0034146A0A